MSNIVEAQQSSQMAEKAIRYILQRVVSDRDFSWLMIGTESMRLCLDSIAEIDQISVSDVEAKLHKNMELANAILVKEGREKAEVVILRERVKELEDQAAGKMVEPRPDSRPSMNVENGNYRLEQLENELRDLHHMNDLPQSIFERIELYVNW